MKKLWKVRDEMEDLIYEEGERATFDAGIHGLHPEGSIIRMTQHRTSWYQNVLLHSKEVAYIAGIMAAAELGGNIQIAKRAGLLHDIGKAVNHEVGAKSCGLSVQSSPENIMKTSDSRLKLIITILNRQP